MDPQRPVGFSPYRPPNYVSSTPSPHIVNRSWRQDISSLIDQRDCKHALQHLMSAIREISTITDEDVASLCQQVREKDRHCWNRLLLAFSGNKNDQNESATASYILGVQCWHDYDWLDARMYFEAAANLGSPSGANSLGVMLLEGQCGEPNLTKALFWLEYAAKLHNTSAMNKLGHLYEHGKAGVEQNLSAAWRYYQCAADRGDPLAMYNLGRMFLASNRLSAVHYIQQAADAGHEWAMNTMGNFFASGWGVTQDYAEAFHYYSLAAKKNNVSALCNVGRMHLAGYGVDVNYKTALLYFDAAANKGSAEAKNHVGVMYVSGFGVQPDYHVAAKYFSEASEMGYEPARENLAGLRARGWAG